jgi:hypothetical protein
MKAAVNGEAVSRRSPLDEFPSRWTGYSAPKTTGCYSFMVQGSDASAFSSTTDSPASACGMGRTDPK